MRIRDLARSLGVHEMTVRRDLDALSEQGLMQRLRGGARLTQQAGAEVAYTLRVAQQLPAKARIAGAALGLVQAGDIVGLDASTTALALEQRLGERPVQAVVTSLDVANALASAGIGSGVSAEDSLAMSEGTVGQSFEVNSGTMLSGFGDGDDDDDDDEDMEDHDAREQQRRGSAGSAFSEDEQVGELSFDDVDMDYR